ncbi:MAG TPA: protein-disulfide reductase DsbD domain-containing protein [Acidobacteriaceae bacterium]
MMLPRFVAFAVMLAGVCGSAQTLNLDSPARKGHVSYIAEPATVQEGKASDVELYFRVADGMHINSHTPGDSTLIPTTLTLQPLAGVKADSIRFPAGTKYAFSFAPREKLSVYTGDFVVKVRVNAVRAGSYTLAGALRYQSCDNMQCYPIKTLPVAVILTVR